MVVVGAINGIAKSKNEASMQIPNENTLLGENGIEPLDHPSRPDRFNDLWKVDQARNFSLVACNIRLAPNRTNRLQDQLCASLVTVWTVSGSGKRVWLSGIDAFWRTISRPFCSINRVFIELFLVEKNISITPNLQN